MPPPANESQGLKIAVAAFVALTVILSVTSYFLYSSYAQTYAKLEAASTEAQNAKTAQATLQTQLNELRDRLGFKTEDYDALKAEIAKDLERRRNDVAAIANEVKAIVDEYQAKGGNDSRVLQLQQSIAQVAQAYASEPNQTYVSAAERLRELLSNQAQLAMAFGVDNQHLRSDLESAVQVNAKRLQVQEEQVAKTEEDLRGVEASGEQLRQDLVAKVDELDTDNKAKALEIENLTTTLARTREDYESKVNTLVTQLRYYKGLSEESAEVLDEPDGNVTYVDYRAGRVHTNITPGTGAKLQMRLTVFDRNAPGVPTARPKGSVELIAQDSRGNYVARIVETRDRANPIRNGDILYSPSWSPNRPERFALIGKMDINRDGRDDRGDLKRMIEAYGGVVEYDLPPPNVGREQGKLTPMCRFYVVDENEPIRGGTGGPAGDDEEMREFREKKTDAIRAAADLGISRMELERLLTHLGWSPGMATFGGGGRREMYDPGVSKDLATPPRRNRDQGAAPDTPPAVPDAR